MDQTEFFPNRPKRSKAQKTDVYPIDDFWSLDLFVLEDYGSEKNRAYGYAVVAMDNLSIFGWTVISKNKIAQIIKDSFEKILLPSKIKPNLMETNRGKELLKNNINDIFNKNNIKSYSRYNSIGAVFAEGFDRNIRDLL